MTVIFTQDYSSPLGALLLAADDQGLRGIWFKDQKYFAAGLPDACSIQENAPLRQARLWLDTYFTARDPGALPPLSLQGSPFALRVWQILCDIPFGSTMTYGEIAAIIAKERGIRQMSAQAVGGAVGHNPVSIIVPCHRVLGANGSLTGYAGGIERKRWLLALEQGQDLPVPQT